VIAADGLLPDDAGDAILVGRVWDPDTSGPRVVAARGEAVVDLSPIADTVSELLERPDHVEAVDAALAGPPTWSTTALTTAAVVRDPARPRLIAPVDLQAIKACGVTFAESMIERVIEERVAGDPARAAQVRVLIAEVIGARVSMIRPGSPEAARVKEVLQEQGLWSPYLEVGLGPDPEVFTKAPVLASVGPGAGIGIPQWSSWNNSEPELVLIVDSRGGIVGATLGNDVNLRDVEGRSALLLGRAKDNNASSALGPFIRLFAGSFDIETLRTEELRLEVTGADGFLLEERGSVSRISRPFEELVAAVIGDHHQYPDGFALYTGTPFAPVVDRGEPGQGFTHRAGDLVRIRSAHLGTLVNVVTPIEELPRWTFGVGALLRHLRSVAAAG
jgi:fumarylacetoacetate (FAA) hydrolase family protein